MIAFMLIAMSGMGFLAIRSMQVINAHTVEIATQGAATQVLHPRRKDGGDQRRVARAGLRDGA